MIRIAESDAEIESCYPVVVQLRTHVAAEEFLPWVRRQYAEGYRLAYAEEAGAVVAVAGFRVHHTLYAGGLLHVDDLVTDADVRSAGHGARLFAWLVTRARAQGCRALSLDSAVHRFDAHRFYLRQGMRIASHHFFFDVGPSRS